MAMISILDRSWGVCEYVVSAAAISEALCSSFQSATTGIGCQIVQLVSKE